MSSLSLLGGARASIGRAAPSSIHSCFGQSPCALLADREDERACFAQCGAMESSEGVSCSFSGYRSTSKAARSDQLYDSSSFGNSFRRRGLLTPSAFSRKRTVEPVGEHCSTASLPSSVIPPNLLRGWEGSTATGLGSPSISGRFAPSLKVHRSLSLRPRTGARGEGKERGTRAMAGSPDDRDNISRKLNLRETDNTREIRNSTQSLRKLGSESDGDWEQLNMITKIVSSLAMHGGLVLAGNVLCNITGVDCWGGFKPSIETFVHAVGWAIPPMMALLLILEDEVVKICAPARAIRDVEDEELMDFFVGMNPWQFIFVVAAGSLSEELFFRVAIQGGLAHALQNTARGADEVTIGVSALTTIIPSFTPFAQIFATLLTASLTGSLYYVLSSPKDPTYVIAPVSGNMYARDNKRDIKRRLEAWSERRQLRKIYSPLMEALLALYLGLEWVQTGNIFAPMITHILYSLVVGGNGLRRIHDNKFKLRQRVSEVTEQERVNSDVGVS